MKIAQTCQGDTLANLDQEGPNVNKKQKYVMQTVKHASTKIRGLAPGLLLSDWLTLFAQSDITNWQWNRDLQCAGQKGVNLITAALRISTNSDCELQTIQI